MAAKKVNYVLIPEGEDPYLVLAEAIVWHDDLQQAKIGMAWRLRTKGDVDGKIVLGKCIKVSDLQKEFYDYDFVIVLNREYWLAFTPEQKLALLDHELSHGARALDAETYAPMSDERGRKVWRVKKHDIEEFIDVVKRHGIWKKDLERFAEALRKTKASPLFDGQAPLARDGEDPPTIHVDLEKECEKCGQKGATPMGLCVGCVADRVHAE